MDKQGSTFYFRVVLERQADSQSFGDQYNLSELAQSCPQPLVIVEQHCVQKAWKCILESIGIKKPQCMTFAQAVQYFKEDEKELPTAIIMDVDLQTIEELGPNPTSSQIALDALQRWFGHSISELPTLCVSDVRSRRLPPPAATTTLAAPSAEKHQVPTELVPTPPEQKADPFESHSQKRISLSRPFKNSSLIEALHRLFNTLSLSRNGSQKVVDSSSETPRPLSSCFSDIKTLLVDDNPINRKVVSKMLTRIGLQPQIAQNGREACEAIAAAKDKQAAFDLVFMDVWMPEMNGLEAAAKIRKELALSPTQPYIVAMTACVMPGDKEKCMDAGMNAYISKPIRKEELEAAVHTFTQIVSSCNASEATL